MLSSKILDTFFTLFTKGSSREVFPAVLSLLAIFIYFIVSSKNGLLTKVRKYRRQVKLLKCFPGLTNYPFVGSMPEMLSLCLQPCLYLLPWTEKMSKKYGPVFKFWVKDQPKLYITCPETAVKVMQHEGIQAKPTEAMKVSKACDGEGLIALNNEIHTIRRKQWMQWMTRKTIDGSVGAFRQESVSFCKALEQFAKNGEEFDIVDVSVHCTLRNIGASALGQEFVQNLSESEGKAHIHDLHTFCTNIAMKQFRPWLENDWIYFNLTSTGRETKRCIDRGNHLVKKAVLERKLLRQQENSENSPCFLDHLLDLRDQGHLTDSQIIKELNVFIVAGYDTTGLSIGYTLYLLSQNPECQSKVVEELMQIFGKNLDDLEEITPAHLKQMKYLELCIKESLRIYPIAPYSFRRSTREVILSDNKIIPANCDIFLGIYHIHRNPKYFPDPEKFLPERHLVPNPYFVPFALGARNCIGQVYAMQEMKMILAHLLMNYKWETTEKGELKLICNTFLLPENGIHFKVEKRF